MKNIKKDFYILTISKKDPEGLMKTINSVEHFKTDFNLVHILKIFCLNSEKIETYKSNNSKRITIYGFDKGIYNSMNELLVKVPLNAYTLFLNSGDTISGILKLKNFEKNDDFFLVNTYKEYQNKKNLIKIKNNFFNGMPFSHQALIFKKKSGMYFNEIYKICGDYDFIIKWMKDNYKSPLHIKRINEVNTIFDINGISSKKRFHRDLEGYRVILNNYGFLKSFIYIVHRLKRYIEIIFTK